MADAFRSIGNMRVTDQIDAMETTGLNSATFLILPRVVSGFAVSRMLHVVALAVGVASGAQVVEGPDIISAERFTRSAREWFNVFDLFYGIVKSLAFGLLITSVACWKGYLRHGGAQGVRRATTEAVVTGCLMVSLPDYALAEMLL